MLRRKLILVIFLALMMISGCTGVFVRDLPLPDKPSYPHIDVMQIKHFPDYYFVPKVIMTNIMVKDSMCRGYANELRQIILTTHD